MPVLSFALLGILFLCGIWVSTGEGDSLVTGPPNNFLNLPHPLGNRVGRQAVTGGNLREFEHVKEENVQWLDNSTRKILGALRNVLPIVDRGLERNLTQVSALLATLADPEDNNGRNSGNQSADDGSNKRVIHFLVGCAIESVLAGADGGLLCADLFCVFIYWES